MSMNEYYTALQEELMADIEVLAVFDWLLKTGLWHAQPQFTSILIL